MSKDWNWKQCEEDFILFIEAGFIAVNHADEDTASKLFKAAELLNPTNHLAKLGMGYLYLHMMDLKRACKSFEEALEADPKNEMARAMLGISMSLDPNMTDKAEKILEQTHHSHDTMIQQLSESALNFVNKFIKKAPSPVQGQSKKQ